MKKKLIGIITGVAACLTLALSASAAAGPSTKIGSAEFDGNSIAVTATAYGKADGVILQLSTDKAFKKDVTTLGTNGAKLVSDNTGKEMEGIKVSVRKYTKRGMTMIAKTRYNTFGDTESAVIEWDASGKAKKTAALLNHSQMDGNYTFAQFQITTTRKYDKDDKVYVRVKSASGKKWGSFSSKKTLAYSEEASQGIPSLKEVKKEIKSIQIESLSVKNVKDKKLTVKKGGKVQLQVRVMPSNADGKTTYTSSDKKIAAVSSAGVVKGVKKGTAKITVKQGGRKVTISVTVK